MADKWIQAGFKSGTLHAGWLTAQAQRAGAYHDGKIDVAWRNKMAQKSGRLGRAARLARSFSKMG